MRRGLRWRCRGLVEDPAAEVDAAVWQQIAGGVTAPIDIYWGSVTALRRVKRRELRRRERDPEPISNDLLDTWSNAARDDVDVVIDRMAIRQLLATLAPDPSPAARQWIAQVSQGHGAGGAMPSATRMAGARWARRVREQAVEAYACAAG